MNDYLKHELNGIHSEKKIIILCSIETHIISINLHIKNTYNMATTHAVKSAHIILSTMRLKTTTTNNHLNKLKKK